jgi:hypothetical protein
MGDGDWIKQNDEEVDKRYVSPQDPISIVRILINPFREIDRNAGFTSSC